MKILIIGAGGFIGNSCYRFFSKEHVVTGVDLSADNDQGILSDPDFSITIGLIKKNKYDFILNCSGSSDIGRSFTEPERDFMLNTVFVQKLLVLVKEHSPTTKVINISSAAVYGNPINMPIDEDTPTKPLSPYGLHKLLSEGILSQYAALFNLYTLSVRIFSAYGPGLRRQFFFDLYTKFNSNAKEIELAGTGRESRDFVFISDIVCAIDILMQKASFKGEIYNLGGQEESFIAATSQLFADVCGFKGEIKFNQEQFKGYPLNWKADITKLASLGYAPKVPLRQGLQEYATWLKKIKA